MSKALVSLLITFVVAAVLVVGCQQAAPPAPAKPTAAPAANPTAAPVPPTAVSTKAPEPAKKVDYPVKGRPITFIVTWTPGGGGDVSARVLATQLEKQLNTTFSIVNKGGAGTQEGLTEIFRAKPDGYTIGQSTLPSNITTYLDKSRQAVYSRKDFQPIAPYAANSVSLTVKADSPYKTLKDFVDAAKAKPGQITIGGTGVLTIGTLAMLMLEKDAGVSFQFVQFPGGTEATTALLGGHLDAVCTGTSSFMSGNKAGTLRLLASSGHQRDKVLPDVKTFEEQGYKVFITNSYGVIAPAGFPKEMVDVLNSDIKTALQADEVKQKFDGISVVPDYMDPAQFATFWADMESSIAPLLALAH